MQSAITLIPSHDEQPNGALRLDGVRVCLLARSTVEHIRGGMETHLQRLAHGLAGRGADVTILTTAHPGCGPRCAQDPLVRHLPGTTPGQWTPAFARAAEQAIAALEAERPLHIFHSQSTAAREIRGLDGRLVVNYHGVLHSESPLCAAYLRAVNPPEAARTLWRQRALLAAWPGMYRADRRIVARATRLIAVSAFAQAQLARWFPSCRGRTMVVSNGVDTTTYHPGLRQEAPGTPPTRTVFAIGRLEATKGMHVLVDAAARLRDVPGLRIEIGGVGPEAGALQRRIAEYGLGDRVVLLGRVAPEELPRRYANADLFVHPELTSPAFGLVSAEALSAGTPVVASRVGALPEVVSEEVGRLVPPGDAGALAAALAALLGDPARLTAMRRAARDRAERLFSERAWLDGIARVYRGVIDQAQAEAA